MRFHLTSLLSDEPDGLRGRILGIYLVLFAFNLGAWVWAVIVFHDLPFLIGTALLAYSLGLRHAVDADHIAAIDNVTRNMMQNGKRPATVGLMFSLGHSTIVLIGAAAIAGTYPQHREVRSRLVARSGPQFPLPVAIAARTRCIAIGIPGVFEMRAGGLMLKPDSTCFLQIPTSQEFIVRCFV
jgi:hypothetical protein